MVRSGSVKREAIEPRISEAETEREGFSGESGEVDEIGKLDCMSEAVSGEGYRGGSVRESSSRGIEEIDFERTFRIDVGIDDQPISGEAKRDGR